jgi:hypothetical protein
MQRRVNDALYEKQKGIEQAISILALFLYLSHVGSVAGCGTDEVTAASGRTGHWQAATAHSV